MYDHLTESQLEFQKKIRQFVYSEIAPVAGDHDINGSISRDLINKIAGQGYLGSMIKKEYAGTGYDNLSIALLNEEIGKACSSVRALLTVHGMVALAIMRWGSKEQQQKYLPKLAQGVLIGAFALTEPNAGSDTKSIETILEKKSNKLYLNGKKKWITMGQIADVFLVICQYENKPTAVLIDKNEQNFSVNPIKGLMGCRGSMIAELVFEDYYVKEDQIIGRQGMGMSHVALNSLDYGRFTIACGCVGLAQACLEACLSYTRQRKQFGEPIRTYQLVQKMITGMVVNVKAARLLCHNAARLRDEHDPNSIVEIWAAKYFCAKMATEVAADAVQIHGANGCINQSPVERFYRDAKINEIIEGTNEMHERLIALNSYRRTY